jgi:hypothetical protein
MSPIPPDGMSTGRFVRAYTVALPPIEVDCSGWEADIPPEQWSTGRFESVCVSLPAVVGEFVPAPEEHFEIAVRFAPDADPARVEQVVGRVMAAVHAAAPDLDLTRAPTGGDVVIAVTGPADARIETVAEAVRGIVATYREVTSHGVRPARAA